jgi:hypothetical protein
VIPVAARVWNTLPCSSQEQVHGAVAQGFPLAPERRPRAARWHGLVLTMLSVLAPCAAASDACKGIDVTRLPALSKLSRHLWRVAAARGEADESNRGVTTQIVLARDGARLWLIGSGPTPAFGAALSCAVEKTIGRAVTDVINTRPAPELALGNIAFAGARLWALPDVIAAMRARCLQCQERLKARLGAAGASLLPESIRAPSVPVAALGVDAGRLGPFAWRALERQPGERVLVLRHRQDAVVVAQGLLWADDVPDLQDTRSDAMLASLHALRAFALGSRLLGEQGDVSALSAVTRHIGYIESLRQAVQPHLIRGDVQGAAGAEIELPEFADLPGYALRHPLNVQRVWRELEPTIFR